MSTEWSSWPQRSLRLEQTEPLPSVRPASPLRLRSQHLTQAFRFARISELTVAGINPILGLDLVMFWHNACAITGAGIRAYRAGDYTVPEPDDLEYILPPDTDLFSPFFHDTEDGLELVAE